MFYNGENYAEYCFGLVKVKRYSRDIKFAERGIKSLKIKGKTIIVLCGNNTRNPNKAAVYANNCFDWLEDYQDRRDITAYSIFYPNDQPLLNTFEPNPLFDYEGLASILFNQLIYEGGQVLPAEQIADNFNDVMFFGHSIGGYVMNELMENLGKMLERENFDRVEINRIYSRIVFVGYSPFRFVKAPTKNVYITPIYDSVGSLKLSIDEFRNRKSPSYSTNNFDIEKTSTEQTNTPHNFREQYKESIHYKDIAYMKARNLMIATPDLMYDDGFKEDHNLAGVINYQGYNPYKTNAGILATKLMELVFCYCLSVDRKKFSMAELYREALSTTIYRKDETKEV